MAEKLVQLKKKGGGGGSQGLNILLVATNSQGGTYNIQTVLANAGVTNISYKDLTTDNFFTRGGSSVARVYEGLGGLRNPSMSYNASTGMLSVDVGRSQGYSLSENIAYSIPYQNVYLVY